MEKVIIWFKAHYQNYPFWRVEYKDKKKTCLLYHSEAKSLSEVFNGRLYIDYDGAGEFLNKIQ